MVHPTMDSTRLSGNGPSLTIFLSNSDLTQLNIAETEGVYFATDGMEPVRYSVEKDFPCIHPNAAKLLEPETESFPAPPDFESRKRQ